MYTVLVHAADSVGSVPRVSTTYLRYISSTVFLVFIVFFGGLDPEGSPSKKVHMKWKMNNISLPLKKENEKEYLD